MKRRIHLYFDENDEMVEVDSEDNQSISQMDHFTHNSVDKKGHVVHSFKGKDVEDIK